MRAIPYVLLICSILNTILSYVGIELEIISAIAGISFIPWLFVLLSSYVFKFCKYHRLMIWYCGFTEVLAWIDYYHKIPISDNVFFVLLLVILGIFLFLITYYKIKNK